MEFIFVCPETNQVFDSEDFKIIDNNGVKTDDFGNKYLDAKVELLSPCPCCGKIHVFHARDLACPFGNAD